ncbi:MAG: hypothetical protein R3D71_00695 [Rickettsiales bacterium]
MRFNSPILFLAVILSVTGCTSSLEKLQKISPVAGDFNSALAAEYQAYAESEDEQGRYEQAEYYAYKGIRAVKGYKVEPEEISFNFQDNSVIKEYRAQLIDLLSGDVKRVIPQKAARAQMLFDCWSKQEERANSQDDVYCKDEFVTAYEELKEVAGSLIHGADSKNAIKFYPTSTRLDAEAKYVIAKLVSHLRGHSDYMLKLVANGYVNNSKSSKSIMAYNRLVAVKNRLIKEGVPKENIVFILPYSGGVVGGMVYLSNDDIRNSSDEVYVIITSDRMSSLVSR